MDVKPPTTKDLRNFGLVMGGAISILGLIRFAIHHSRVFGLVKSGK